jgi:hypothetical protein
MKLTPLIPFALLMASAAAAQSADSGPPAGALQPWQSITQPTVAEAASAFPAPPHEYGTIHWAIWGGEQSKEKILADIEHLYANGTYIIMIDNSSGLRPKYFTPEYLDLVKFLVAECKKRGMKVWIEGDAGYPDGFAGGMISKDYPQLGMQGIVADARYSVVAGETLKTTVPPGTLGILAYTPGAAICKSLPIPADGQLQWTAPEPGASEVVFVRHIYRSSPTRFVNRADGTRDKDSLYSEIDYLDPEATRTYIHLIFDTYAKVVGDEFGKTILGFRGDETDYTGFMPWTPKLLETFQREKGYDLQPYIAQFFAPTLTAEARKAKADYWDVWSGMFRDNFYKPLAEWCAAHGMEYMTHLNHEELMIDWNRGEDLVRNEGSFFRDMRYVQAPGVDNLNQIGPGVVADFPKLATSAAHLFGHPQVWEEEGGNPYQAGKFIADYNFVRGMNFLQIRGMNNPPDAAALVNPAAATGWYVNRASYLLATGRPGAQIALYHPTDNLWYGDKEADDVTVKLVTQLMEHQRDFDHIDLDALVSVCTLDGGGLRNLSGQVYKAIVVPPLEVIDQRMLDRLRAFAAAGGKVVFVGHPPALVANGTFLNATPGPVDLSFATVEPQPEITDAVLAALPAPEVALDTPCPPLKYIRRDLKDGEVYFFFNESNSTVTRTATLAGTGDVQVWDATSGTIHPLAGVAKADGSIAVPLTLAPHETRFVVIGPLPAGAGDPAPTVSLAQTVADLGGNWAITLGDKQVTSTLKSWRDLGAPAFAGRADYKQSFTAPDSLPAGKRIYLDLGNAHEIARVTLNGTVLEARPWPSYLWDVTAAIKGGANAIEVEVEGPAASAGRGGFGEGVAAGSGRRRAGRPGETVASTAAPAGFSPSGVPGGLGGATGGNPFGGGRAGFAPGGPPLRNQAAEPEAKGLLGPVRVLAE